jgi:hypothetical protein
MRLMSLSPRSIRTSFLSLLLLPLGFTAWTSAQAATNYYVRTDGGDATQCNGRADTRYPGSGTGQACAWKHPFYALSPSGTKRIASGDTLLINSGNYMMGQGAPGAGSCSGNSCFMTSVPSGTSSAKTRILGHGATKPVLWGSGGASKILNLEGSNNVEVGFLELTDRSDCVSGHTNATAACTGGAYAKTGLSASASSNVWLHDLNIHGMAHQGIRAGGLNNWTVERVKIVANGRVGWEGNIGTGSSNSGNIVLREVEVGWNGCGERWETGTPWACWAQQTGGYGDGLGTTYTGGHWLIEDSYFHHNTSDGLDLRYMDGADTTDVIVRRTYAVANAGNQIKVRGNSTIENNVIVSTCGYFEGKYYMVYADNCRASGNTLQLVLTSNDIATVRHNTITGEGGVLIGANEGDSTNKIRIQNNVLVGFPTFLDPSKLSSVFYANAAPAAVSWAGNLVWNVKSATCPSGSVCGQNPKLANMALYGFDAEPLAGSPVIDKVPVMSGVNSDFVAQPRPSGAASDIGAYELQAGGSDPTPTPTPTPTCTRSKPTVTLSGATTSVAAGTTRTYTLAVRNNDTSACSNTTFKFARTVPSGWTGTLSATSTVLAPGATANATLSVKSPTTAAAGTYGIGAATSSTVGSTHTANDSIVYSVAPKATSTGFTETVSTDKSSYAAKSTVYMTARVLKNGAPVRNVSVRFGALKPNGINEDVLKSTTNSNGYAKVAWVSDSGPSSIGTYKLTARATSGSTTVYANTTFSVYTP